MSDYVNKSFVLSSSLNMEEEERIIMEKQGMISILVPDSDQSVTGTAVSLRRTLSADMSSKIWMSQNDVSPAKKIASSEESKVEEDEPKSRLEIWDIIREDKNKKNKGLEQPAQLDTWSCILSNKKEEEDPSNQTIYVPPPVKRASSLNEKSLQICTESLGSETGSDGFTAYPHSDPEVEKEVDQEALKQYEEFVMQSYLVAKKTTTQRSFPPAIPSLSGQDGASLQMRTCRDNGRLVLEAVSVPSPNNFRAQRQDGRLVLTLTESDFDDQEDEEEEEEQKLTVLDELDEEFESFEEERTSEDEDEEDDEDGDEEDDEDGEEEKEEDYYPQMHRPTKLTNGSINVHRLALLTKKPIQVPYNFNKTVKQCDTDLIEIVESPTLAISLPPQSQMVKLMAANTPPVVTTVGSFNAYDYYWRPKPMMIPCKTFQFTTLKNNNNGNKEEQQDQLIVSRRNNQEFFVPFVKGCNEQRKSLLFWEPYCIAT